MTNTYFWGGSVLQESSRQHVSSFSEVCADVRVCVCACVRGRVGWRGLHESVPPPSLPPSPPSQSGRSKVSERTAETLQTLLKLRCCCCCCRNSAEVKEGGPERRQRVDTSEEKLSWSSLRRAEWRGGGTEPVPRSTCEPRGHRRRCFFFSFLFLNFSRRDEQRRRKRALRKRR